MFTQAFVATLLATAAIAAPAPPVSTLSKVVSSTPDSNGFHNAINTKSAPGEPDWIIENLSRKCDDRDVGCTYTYSINTQKKGGKPYDCKYTVHAKDGSPASKSPAGPVDCAVFSVTHAWIDDDKDGEGYTLIMPEHLPTHRIIYAGYDDKVLFTNGTVVRPNNSVPVQFLD